MGWIWLTSLGHSHESGLIHADSQLQRFLLQNKKKLDDSFVIIMGDHGLLMGKTISISAYVPEEVTKTYQIAVKAMPPCDGEFKAVVRQVNENFEMASASIDRLDRYGNNGDCIESGFKHLCHCKAVKKEKDKKKVNKEKSAN
ncbi:unnamed protein product [Strongylus vulgaris]|uniref:Uncharacterized protein n=1 Tax=Strongylus vulgaris TaxID=40348 RepID=A0A3P7LQM1_STRVU|nr:unnamed protein product [Strongylus vulgaris]